MLDLTVVAENLASAGVDAEVIDLRTSSPPDMDTVLSSVKKTGRAVIVHEAVRSFGVGAEVAAPGCISGLSTHKEKPCQPPPPYA
jgi:pyruvate/2-oxoglutarate/acetoin dehydrogenase E1 component